MAQYGGEQYQKEEINHGAGHNQLHSTTTTGHEIGGTGTNIHSTTAGHGIGGTGATIGTGGGHGYEEGKHGGGILHRSGSGSSSSSESDGEGGRRKKKGVVGKTSDTATVGGGGYGHEGLGEEGHEKKGLMEKIKEKLPGGHQ